MVRTEAQKKVLLQCWQSEPALQADLQTLSSLVIKGPVKVQETDDEVSSGDRLKKLSACADKSMVAVASA